MPHREMADSRLQTRPGPASPPVGKGGGGGRFAVRILLGAAALVLAGGVVHAQTPLPRPLREVGIDQRLNAQVPPDLMFRDETGAEVRLGDYFGRRPVILVLAYFRCPMLCTRVLNGLTHALWEVTLNPGSDFDILTVSFDPRETPELAAAKKKSYVQRYARAGAERGWHFLTGEEPAIKRLAGAVGFRYKYLPDKDQYAHASGIMVLTPEGKVSRYFYGLEFEPRDLRLGLVEASANKIGSPVDQVLLFCFHYDPAEGRYGLAVMNLVRLGGALTLLAIGLYFLASWRRERRKARRAAAGAGGAERGGWSAEGPAPHPPLSTLHPPLPAPSKEVG